MNQIIQERFEKFLHTYKDKQGNLTYWTRVQQMSINDETAISVDYQDLIRFDDILFEYATQNMEKFIKIANSALLSVLTVEDPDYLNDIDTALINIKIVNYPLSDIYTPDTYCPFIKGICKSDECRFYHKKFECIIKEWMMTGIEHNVNWK